MQSPLSSSEFIALRQTIATRGTLRVALFPAIVAVWSALGVLSLLSSNLPVLALFSLAVLVAGFEAIHALHVGVERIGRYLQVFYEGTPDGPRWESTAMAVGPALPGGGVDPLFSIAFSAATLLNLLPALLPQPTPVELTVIAACHFAFLLRVARARLAAARQRAVELESYRALRAAMGDPKP
jgi:hypothetical protein